MRRQSKRKWAVLLGGENLSMQDLISYARMAQDAGADSVWSCELWRDGFVPLAAMAAAAPNLRVQNRTRSLRSATDAHRDERYVHG